MHWPFFDLKYPFDGFLVENIATYPVHCICRITDDSSTSELFGNLPYLARLRIIWINRNQHSYSIKLSELSCKMKQT